MLRASAAGWSSCGRCPASSSTSTRADAIRAARSCPDYPGPGTTKILLDVPEGASLDVIGGLLVDRDVIKSKKAWDRAVRTEERATSVQAGRYLMKTQMKSLKWSTMTSTYLCLPTDSGVTGPCRSAWTTSNG